MTRKLESLATKLGQLDLAIPDDAQPLLALRAAITEASVGANPLAVLEDDIEAGTVTAADAATRIHAVALDLAAKDKATQVAQNLEPLLDRLGGRWMRTNGDRVIDVLRPAFEQAIADLTGTVAALGAKPNDQAVLAAGPAAATAWKQRTNTIRRLDMIARCVHIIEDAGYRTVDNITPARWLAEAADEDTLTAAHRYLGGTRFAEGIADGVVFRLNTNDDAAAVIAAARARTSAQRAAAAQAAEVADQGRKARFEQEKQADIARLKQLAKSGR